MKQEEFKITMQVEDIDGKTAYMETRFGDAPTIDEFANFCYNAAKAYGFSVNSIDKVIKFTY